MRFVIFVVPERQDDQSGISHAAIMSFLTLSLPKETAHL
jgi:hypothetical protein